METQVRTPQLVFMQPQRLVVPLFQRPYVWNEEDQWEPLWVDVLRVAMRLLNEPSKRHQPHFLGAVVIQQSQTQTGAMQERTIIDGQQRLTTLQLLLDALEGQLQAAGARQHASRIESLVANPKSFCERPEDRLKVWPTTRDRPAFDEVMSAPEPIDYDGLQHGTSRMARAHRYFALRAGEWLQVDAADNVRARATALERGVREMMQMVVIDLGPDEDAQAIFETLNARGAQLTAADLIKNYVFQRLIETGSDVNRAYDTYWKEFETGFWETEVRSGKATQRRSSQYLNHWLIAKTAEEILAREVFKRFKDYVQYDFGGSMYDLLPQIHRGANLYRRFIMDAETPTGTLDRLGLFAYRTGVLESEVVKPLILYLLDPEQDNISNTELTKCIASLESWLVRRTLVRASSRSYNQVIADLIKEIRKADRRQAGQVVESYLREQTAAGAYWPDDDEVRRIFPAMPVYRRLSRARLRMILEALEDHLRGWDGAARGGFVAERVPRGQYAIEHILPRHWQTNWPLARKGTSEQRDALVHTIGNLTLVTGRLNSRLSNAAWRGPEGKRQALHRHDVLMLNRTLLDSRRSWTDEEIVRRSADLTEMILAIWPTPTGHRVNLSDERREAQARRVEVADLISAGLLNGGATLYARRQRVADRVATVLSDGSIDVNGTSYATPSGAARAITGKHDNGWWFWLIDPKTRRSLSDLWHQYVAQRDLEAEVDVSDVPDAAEERG